MIEDRAAAARVLPWALLAAFGVTLPVLIGWPWTVLIAGTIAAAVVVVLAIARRRPIEPGLDG